MPRNVQWQFYWKPAAWSFKTTVTDVDPDFGIRMRFLIIGPFQAYWYV